MKKINHDINDMQQLAETGWKQMHEMLRERGLSSAVALKPAKNKKRILLAIAAFILFISLFLSWPYLLNDKNSITSSSKKILATSGLQKILKQPLVKNQTDLEINNATSPTSLSEKASVHQKINSAFIKYQRENGLRLLQAQRQALLQKIAKEHDYKLAIPIINEPIDTLPKFEKTVSYHKEKIVKPVHKKIRLFAGIGLNASLGNRCSSGFNFGDLNIQPGITIEFPLSEKFSLHTGLWAFSTIHGKEIIAKEKELVNNYAGNVYYNIKTTSIIKASYFEVPLTLNYSLNKNWSVGGGLQIAKLYKVSIKEEKESFDYNNMLVASSVNQNNSTPLRAAATFQNQLEIKKFEPRLMAEANYEKHRFLFSAGYYYGIGKTIEFKDAYNNKHQYRNEYFKLGIQYKLSSKK